MAAPWCCTARRKAPLRASPDPPPVQPTLIAEQQTLPTIRRSPSFGGKWIAALLEDKAELAKETCLRFKSTDDMGHVICGGDGLIEEKEAVDLVNTICMDAYLLPPRKERTIELFRICDKDGSGKLGAPEFAIFFKKVLQDVDRKMKYDAELQHNALACCAKTRQ